ncbi:MAG: hypothetical protein GY705_07620, partial [Bacteroidetes bacterium]|nr:hypothetical protein [Bacteroidota bacterium]
MKIKKLRVPFLLLVLILFQSCVAPNPPSRLKIDPVSGPFGTHRGYNISWQDNADDESGYYVQKKVYTVPAWSFWKTTNPIASGRGSTIDTENVSGRMNYRVAAFNSFGVSDWIVAGPAGIDVRVNLNAQIQLLPAPVNFRASQGTVANMIYLDWDEVPDAIGYNIYEKNINTETYILLNSNPIQGNLADVSGVSPG